MSRAVKKINRRTARRAPAHLAGIQRCGEQLQRGVRPSHWSPKVTTSNTKDVFRWAVGKTVVGMYVEGVREHAGEIVVLVLSDGTGIAFGTGNGTHWCVSQEDVAFRAHQRRTELEQAERDLREALTLESVLGSPRSE